MRVLGDLTKFSLLKPNSGVVFDNAKRREVRLELNTQAPCQLMLESAGEVRFLANVDGRETLTFVAEGPVTVWPDSEGEVWFWSPEFERVSVVVENPEIFTRMATREARNPQVERMGQLMMANVNRMFAQVERDVGLMRRENQRLQAEAAARAAEEVDLEELELELAPEPEPEKAQGKKKEPADAGA